MKVLTIKEPYASLIIEGIKQYEFRTWKTSHRGKLLIHAGLGIDKEMLSKVDINITSGAIIGEVELINCILVDKEFDKQLKKTNPTIYGNDHEGVYAWELTNVKKYDNPIYIKGKLGLWNYGGD